jgi:hypothetical protein
VLVFIVVADKLNYLTYRRLDMIGGLGCGTEDDGIQIQRYTFLHWFQLAQCQQAEHIGININRYRFVHSEFRLHSNSYVYMDTIMRYVSPY